MNMNMNKTMASSTVSSTAPFPDGQHLAKRQPAGQLADPDLLQRGLFCADHLGALQASARTLDQQRAQVGVAAAARPQPGVSAAGVLGRHQTQPAMRSSCRPLLNSRAEPTLATIASVLSGPLPMV